MNNNHSDTVDGDIQSQNLSNYHVLQDKQDQPEITPFKSKICGESKAVGSVPV